jgi:16S rRNA processing protein RimM
MASAVVIGSYGVRGELKLKSYSGETAHLLKIAEARLRKGEKEIELKVERARASGDVVYLKLAGYDSPEKAKELAGFELMLDRARACPLREGEWYIADLVDCELVAEGASLGRVVGVCETSASDLLEVRLAAGGTRLVPFDARYIGDIDIAAKRMELVSPWILD